MPSRNSLKEYVEGGIYHIYNRGIDKRDVFTDSGDYKYFLHLLKVYLQDPKKTKRTVLLDDKHLYIRRNFFGKIDLLCYCLMPNHFHFIIRQREASDITEFMKCLMTSYSMYFNIKHKRTGTLFQGRYKAVLVKDDNYILHLSRYIHMNPIPKRTVLLDEKLKKLAESF